MACVNTIKTENSKYYGETISVKDLLNTNINQDVIKIIEPMFRLFKQNKSAELLNYIFNIDNAIMKGGSVAIDAIWFLPIKLESEKVTNAKTCFLVFDSALIQKIDSDIKNETSQSKISKIIQDNLTNVKAIMNINNETEIECSILFSKNYNIRVIIDDIGCLTYLGKPGTRKELKNYNEYLNESYLTRINTEYNDARKNMIEKIEEPLYGGVDKDTRIQKLQQLYAQLRFLYNNETIQNEKTSYKFDLNNVENAINIFKDISKCHFVSYYENINVKYKNFSNMQNLAIQIDNWIKSNLHEEVDKDTKINTITVFNDKLTKLEANYKNNIISRHKQIQCFLIMCASIYIIYWVYIRFGLNNKTDIVGSAKNFGNAMLNITNTDLTITEAKDAVINATNTSIDYVKYGGMSMFIIVAAHLFMQIAPWCDKTLLQPASISLWEMFIRFLRYFDVDNQTILPVDVRNYIEHINQMDINAVYDTVINYNKMTYEPLIKKYVKNYKGEHDIKDNHAGGSKHMNREFIEDMLKYTVFELLSAYLHIKLYFDSSSANIDTNSVTLNKIINIIENIRIPKMLLKLKLNMRSIKSKSKSKSKPKSKSKSKSKRTRSRSN